MYYGMKRFFFLKQLHIKSLSHITVVTFMLTIKEQILYSHLSSGEKRERKRENKTKNKGWHKHFIYKIYLCAAAAAAAC